MANSKEKVNLDEQALILCRIRACSFFLELRIPISSLSTSSLNEKISYINELKANLHT